MKRGEKAGLRFVPFVSRMVLAVAFMPLGWHMVMSDTSVFRGHEAAVLERLGVGVPLESGEAAEMEQVAEEAAAEGASAGSNGPMELFVAETEQAERADGGEAREAKSVHAMTVLLVDRFEWLQPYRPHWIVTGVAWANLMGGALLLIGLFARLSGFLMAATTVLALYLMVTPGVIENFAALVVEDYTRIVAALGLFVLAVGVMFFGPGGASVDAVIRSVRRRANRKLAMGDARPA